MSDILQSNAEKIHTKGQLPHWLQQIQRHNEQYNHQLLGERLVVALIRWYLYRHGISVEDK